MLNDRRRFFLILFLGIFVPFLVVVTIPLLNPASRRTIGATGPAGSAGDNGVPGAGTGDNGGGPDNTPDNGPLQNWFARPRNTVAYRSDNAPLLAAGSGADLWVVHPFLLKAKDSSTPVFEMLHRTGNSGLWMTAVNLRGAGDGSGGGGEASWYSFPQALAALPAARPNIAPALVMNDGGAVSAFLLTRKFIEENLPPSHTVRAAAGSTAGAFVLTVGPPLAATTQPGDRLTEESTYYRSPFETNPLAQSEPAPQSAPASQPSFTQGRPSTDTAPATQASTLPSTAPATTRASSFFNIYWFKDDHWIYLPPLGEHADHMAPTVDSFVSLAVSGDRLLALWIDPMHPGDLVVRSVAFKAPAPAAWSAPILSPTGAQSLSTSRLLTATVDNNLYVFWTVPTGSSIQLEGGMLTSLPGHPADLTLQPANRLHAINLGPASGGISPATDVALGASENTLFAIINAKDGKLVAQSFDTSGRPLAGPATIEPTILQPDLHIAQNIAMLVVILTFSLLLWQWRQKPIELALPAGMIAAPLHLRLAAALVDLAVPYLVVLTIFNLWDSATTLAPGWISGLSHPEELGHSFELLVFLAIYLFHVTFGELLFRRTLGKLLLGLQVLMVDGRAPTLAAILLRNLLRIPDLLVGVVILALSDHRQRIGDFLARTLVVSQKPPELPEDPDQSPPAS